jgi:hypothetical protein
MLIIDASTYEKFAKACAFAVSTGQAAKLFEKLDYLSTYGGAPDTVCTLYSDFAPHSFRVQVIRTSAPDDKPWLDGALIYHGPHDNGGDGGAPTFSVNLNANDGWSVHT